MAHAPRAAQILLSLGVAAVLPILSGCATDETTIHLVQAGGLPSTSTPHASIPLEITTQATSVKDPLPVRGTEVVYTDLEVALGAAVGSATAPWASAVQKNGKARPGGWQLALELTQADAQETDGRLLVIMQVRATLRGRDDGSYIAQTQASCREGDLVPPERGTSVVFGCARHIGRDLTAWLGAVVDP